MELKPCPFCGCATIVRRDVLGSKGVACFDCEASVLDDDRPSAFAKWNTRSDASHDALVSALEKLERYVSLHAYDQLEKEDGRIFGWSKSRGLSDMLEEAQAALTTAKETTHEQ